MDTANFNQLLDNIYGAAVDPSLWAAALNGIDSALGSHGAVIIRQNEETGEGEGIRAEFNPEMAELYYGYYGTKNVLLATTNARTAIKSYRPGVLTDEHKLAKEDLVRSEFYN